MKLIGIFGGSFDPIHNGHLEVAKAALTQCGLDEVWLMVSPENPLKADCKKTPEQIRLEIARIATEEFIKENPGLEGHIKVCDFEFSLPRPSYTYLTLRKLSEAFPDFQFQWIVGGDNLRSLSKWKNPDEIIKEYGLIVYPRDTEFNDSIPPGVTILKDLPLMDVSSTRIRQLSTQNDPSLLPMPRQAAKMWLKTISKLHP